MSFWVIGISAVVTGVGTYMSYDAQQTAAENTEKAAVYNAKVKRDQAISENEVAAENSRRKAREAARYVSRARADIAARGLTMEGTPLVVLGDIQTELERDIMDASWEASMRAKNLIEGASMDLWEGAAGASAMRGQATATLITGIGSTVGGFASASGRTGSGSTKPSNNNGYLG